MIYYTTSPNLSSKLASSEEVSAPLLRLGDDLTHTTTGKATRRPITPREEGLALYTDLATPS